MDNEQTVVRVRDLTKIYGEDERRVVALDGIDLDVSRGQMTAIMGPSGSGKSTLMHLMAALDEPTSGSIVLEGKELAGMDDAARTLFRRRQVGFVFQAFNLVPTLDVTGNILLPFELDGQMPDQSQLDEIDGLLDDLGIADLRARRPHELSGGQQQRVAIVRALAMKPTVIFADEPTGALDSRTGRDVLELLSEATTKHGQTVVLVTHDPAAAATAERVVFLADGNIVKDVARTSAQDLAVMSLSIEDTRRAGVSA